MSRGRRFLRALAKVLAVFVALVVVTYVVLGILGRRALLRELEQTKASGAPTSWEEVIPPPVPEDQNAALLYARALDVLALPNHDRDALNEYTSAALPAAEERRRQLAEQAQKAAAETGRPDPQSEQLAEHFSKLEQQVSHIVAANARALSYAYQAAERPECRFDRAWSDPITMSMPEMEGLRDLSKLLCAQAMLRAREGDVPGALQSWSCNLALVQHLEPDRPLLVQLHRHAFLAGGVWALRTVAHNGRLSAQRCRELDRQLSHMELREPFLRALQAARIEFLRYLDLAPHHEDLLNKLTWTERLWLRLVHPALVGFDKAAMLDYWQDLIALADRPYRKGGAERWDRLGTDIPRYAFLTRRLAPVWPRATMVRDKALAHQGLARTALGLLAYHDQFGIYPESLHQLRSDLEWEVPRDPFSGSDFVYRRRDSGYLLYSPGADLDDDGGRPRMRADTLDGDIVWRQER